MIDKKKYRTFGLAVLFLLGLLCIMVIYSYLVMPLDVEVYSLLKAVREKARSGDHVFVSPEDPAFELLFFQVRDAVNQHAFKAMSFFLGLVTIGLTVLGYSAVNEYKRRVNLEVRSAARKIVEEQSRLTKAELLATAFNEFNLREVYSFEEVIQKKIEFDLNLGNSVPQVELKKANEALKNSESMLRHGLRLIEAMSPDEKKKFFSEPNCLYSYVCLLNGFVYKETCERIMSGEASRGLALDAVVGKCEEMLRITDNPHNAQYKRLHSKWWLAYETAGFFFVHVGRLLGDQEMRKRGTKILEVIIKQDKPFGYVDVAEDDYRIVVKAEYSNRGLLLS